MNPRNSVCLLVRNDPGDGAKPTFLGTCFAFRSSRRFLTAAHCISGLDPKEIGIFVPETGNTLSVVSEQQHPEADITVLSTADPLQHNLQPFVDHTSRHEIGEDFMAFGFPEDVFAVDRRQPVPRLFKGHFQRFFEHKSHLGFRYVAGELSVGCPGGLSGGPVYRASDLVFRVDGVVTENLESTTVLETLEETETDGAVTRHSFARIINYGLCVMLFDLKEWLHNHAPAESA